MNPAYLVHAKLVGHLPLLDFGKQFADPLYAALQERGFGDITGGSGQNGETGQLEWIGIDIRLVNLDEALEFTRLTLQKLYAPPGSKLEYTVDGKTVTKPVYERRV